jgi:hypothetical protein
VGVILLLGNLFNYASYLIVADHYLDPGEPRRATHKLSGCCRPDPALREAGEGEGLVVWA